MKINKGKIAGLNGRFKGKGGKKWVVAGALVLVALVAAAVLWPKPDAPMAGAQMMVAEVVRGTLSESITGTGSLAALERKTVNSESTGTVSAIYVTEGDRVQKGDLLMTLDSSTQDLNISSSELNLQLEQKSLNDLYEEKSNLYVYAPASGLLSGTLPAVDQSVKSGSTLATITDQSKLQVTAEFVLYPSTPIKLGDTVEFFITEYLQYVYGEVTTVSSSPISGGSTVNYKVVVTLQNPGLLTADAQFAMFLANDYGRFSPTTLGSLSYVSPTNIEIKTDGTLQEIYVSDGEWVEQGQLLAIIVSDTLDDKINSAEIKLQQSRNSLEELYEKKNARTITAPISGTVLSVGVTEGEEVTEQTSSLVTIAYLDAMEVTLSVDELDILAVEKGMAATITSDALPGRTFDAYVSDIALEGTAYSGVAAFDVTLQIDEPGDLRSGMSVNIAILTTQVEDVLLVPLAAITQQGNEYWVTLMDESGGESVRQPVEVGAVSSDRAQIVSGLEEGQRVVYQSFTAAANAETEDSGQGMTGGMPGMGGMGGMPGGGMPTGGMR
ncbi:MAG: efflux RND transporter periplasmic adaptor subunit [Syntrophomonadaceae bacterium]|nr:efflux RND transporter periplasmic adaptor subunit [Syntrophomonadaceae bacterium]